MPLFLKWAFVFVQPDDDSVWLARAAPRDMVAHSDGISVSAAPTKFGKLSFELKLSGARAQFNVTLPPGWTENGGRAPKGGLFLRARAPASLGAIQYATLNGARLPSTAVNATAEAVHITQHTVAALHTQTVIVGIHYS